MKATIRTLSCLILVVLLALAGCSSGGGADPTAPGEAQTPAATEPSDSGTEEGGISANIRYFSWPPEQEAATKTSIEQFNQIHPGIQVDYQIAPWDQYWQKLQTEIAGGAAPDVFMNQTWYFLTLQDAKAAEPLNALIERDGYSLEGHNEMVLDIYTQDGELYVIPQDWDAICIVYNKNLFDEMNMPYPDETLTWNPTDGGSFVELAQKMTTDSSGNTPLDPDFNENDIVNYGFIVNNSDNCFYWNFIYMNGGGIIDFTDPKTVEAMQFGQDLIQKYKVSPQTAQVQSMGVDSYFATGNIAMYTMGNWALKTLESTCDFTWAAAPLPTGPENRGSIVNGIGQSVFSGSSNKDAAWELLKWFGGTESQQIFAETGTVFPSRKEHWDKFIQFWDANGYDIEAYQYTFDTADTFIAELVPNWNEKTDSCFKNIDLLFMGQLTAQECCDNIAADFEAIGD